MALFILLSDLFWIFHKRLSWFRASILVLFVIIVELEVFASLNELLHWNIRIETPSIKDCTEALCCAQVLRRHKSLRLTIILETFVTGARTRILCSPISTKFKLLKVICLKFVSEEYFLFIWF